MMTSEDFLVEAVNEAMRHPRDYWGAITDLQDQGWGVTFGRHRDSDNIDISNYETVLQRFEDLGFEKNDDYRVESSSHWAVGWTDQILVRIFDCNCEDWEEADISYDPNYKWYCATCETWMTVEDIRPIFHECLELRARIEEYPLLDEDDYSRREHEELMEYLESEVSSTVVHLQNDERVAENFEPDMDDIFRYLFDVYSVSSCDDLHYEWVEDAVLAIADKVGKKL